MANKEKLTRRDIIATIGSAMATSAVLSLPVNAEESSQQPAIREWKILRYAFGWNAVKRTGRLMLYLEGASNPVTIDVGSPNEFSGFVTILKEEPVFYNSVGWIHTGTEPVR